MDLEIGKLSTVVIDKHNIKFTKFECCTTLPDMCSMKTRKSYRLASAEEWSEANSQFDGYNKKELIVSRKCSGSCLCNPTNKEHHWIGYYICDQGWNIERIMATIRHCWLWGSVGCYFAKCWWPCVTDFDEAVVNEFWYGYEENELFNNQIGEAAYVCRMYVSQTPNALYATYDEYS